MIAERSEVHKTTADDVLIDIPGIYKEQTCGAQNDDLSIEMNKLYAADELLGKNAQNTTDDPWTKLYAEIADQRKRCAELLGDYQQQDETPSISLAGQLPVYPTPCYPGPSKRPKLAVTFAQALLSSSDSSPAPPN